MDCPHELCHFGSETVALPYAITSEPEILSEILTLETWNELFTAEERSRLMSLLPNLGNSDEHRRTLELIFTGGSMHFGNPVDEVIECIRSGRNQPEVLDLHRRGIRRKKREARYRIRNYYYSLLKQCLSARRKVLEENDANNAAWARQKSSHKRSHSEKETEKLAETLMERAEKRLAKEMKQIDLESMFALGRKSRLKLDSSSSSAMSDEDDDRSFRSLSPVGVGHSSANPKPVVPSAPDDDPML